MYWSCLLLWTSTVGVQLLEIVSIFSLSRFSEDIELMTGSRPGLYLCICWKIISPAIMTAILVAFLLKMFFGDVDYEVHTMDRRYTELDNKYAGLGCSYRQRREADLAMVDIYHDCGAYWHVSHVDTLHSSSRVSVLFYQFWVFLSVSPFLNEIV